jgi:hypothetical protein
VLSAVEQKRLQFSKHTEAKRKSQLGQFLTPERTAAFMPGPGTVPPFYPVHFVGQSTKWPIAGMKKPNAIVNI